MVHINGKDMDVAGQSLMAYLEANDYEKGTFVVECNEEIIHKEDYKTYILKDGDIIRNRPVYGRWLRLHLRCIAKEYSVGPICKVNFSWGDVPVGTSQMYR